MAKVRGTRGYSSYRGKRKGKTVLAVVLALILVLACGFLLAQRYIVYGADGSIRIELPGRETRDDAPQGNAAQKQDGADEADDVEVVIQQPEKQDTCAVELDAAVLSGGWEDALGALGEGVNAVAVRLKTDEGKLLYDSSIAGAIDCGAVAGGSVARSAIRALTDSEYYTIARISALHDSTYAFAHMTDAAVCQLTGYVWYDTNSTHWLAPEKDAARQYVSAVAAECAAMGFDELLLDEFCYPRDGRMSRIKTDERTMTQQEALLLLADEIRAALAEEKFKGKLSVVIDADIVLAGNEERTGIVMRELAPKFDRVYVAVDETNRGAVEAAMAAYETEFVPILASAGESGSWLAVNEKP